ncbi:hypothetical protein [Adhaeribacter soli]|uniref:Uncharacterized protein n=1 Tax=Adhaeribacter soli TaxID=2607655 RepID=A0A5N1J0N5_9BACT|nr:hypothetical protein [Adhaeribacter soli]KAA9340044.1 hypothetical protein F0P94_06760 [Adhaeribacter soli]
MATDKKNNNHNGNDRPVRVIDSTGEDMTEMQAGHLVPGADPPKNEQARGGFGDRDGRTGYGSDSSEGSTATTTNENSEESGHIIPDGIPTAAHADIVDDPIVELPSTDHMQQDVSQIPPEALEEDNER